MNGLDDVTEATAGGLRRVASQATRIGLNRGGGGSGFLDMVERAGNSEAWRVKHAWQLETGRARSLGTIHEGRGKPTSNFSRRLSGGDALNK